MARPFASLGKVIDALHESATPLTVRKLSRATGLSVVQCRRAVWAALDKKLIRFGTPARCHEPGADDHNFYQYNLTMLGTTEARRRYAARQKAASPAP